MLYTVAEISEELGYSKVTIYNKINLLKSDLKGCITDKQGVMYINSKGLLMIKEELGLNALKDKEEIKASNTDNTEGLKHFKEVESLVNSIKSTIEEGQENYINSLLEQVEHLKAELDKKDKQLNNTLKLLENSQVLLKDHKEEKLMLESQEQKKKRTLTERLKGLFR